MGRPQKLKKKARKCVTCGKDAQRRFCKPCSNEKYRNARLLKQYGLTPEAYDLILKSQGGTCAICNNPPKVRRLDVDHNHKTGKVRGLLCHTCNQGLGYLRIDSNAVRCLGIIVYLNRHELGGV